MAARSTAVVADFGKLTLLAFGMLIGGTVLVLGIVRADSAAQLVGSNMVTAVLLYITGNGVLARNGLAPSSVLVAHPDNIQRDADAIAEAIATTLAGHLASNPVTVTPPPYPGPPT